MSKDNIGNAEASLLGQETPYCTQYDSNLLFAIPRQLKRDELNLSSDSLPFEGLDIWTGYEVSWLNLKGKPIVRIVEFAFPADSPNLIESKSFKLYLNSFNGTQFSSDSEVESIMIQDLSAICGGRVDVQFHSVNDEQNLIGKLPGLNLDDLDITINEYIVNSELLDIGNDAPIVDETLNSHLLKSNCLVTGQPDWGSVVIRYSGRQLDHENLLRYLISYREHNEFHEQCVERIFTDIMQHCQPDKLSVYARYVRRGGLDINPYRSNFEDEFDISRLARQ